MGRSISSNIKDNELYVRKRLEDCDDFIIRPMLLGEEKKVHCLVVYIEVAVSNMVLEDSVIGKLVNHMWEMPAEEILQFVKDNGMGISDVKTLYTMEEAFVVTMPGSSIPSAMSSTDVTFSSNLNSSICCRGSLPGFSSSFIMSVSVGNPIRSVM